MEESDLLRGALEKVLYFECRVEQLGQERDAALREAEAARADSRAVRADEGESRARAARADAARASAEAELARLRRALDSVERELEAARTAGDPALRGRLERVERERDEQRARAEALWGERERWLNRMIGIERVHRAGAEDDSPVDLASFIADLRAEVEAVRRGEFLPGAPAANAPVRASPVPRSLEEAAETLRAQGRTGLSAAEWQAVADGAHGAGFGGAAQRSLFSLSVKDLQRGGPDVRARAAERLAELGGPEAAAVLAAALNREEDGSARRALLRAAFRCAKDGQARALCESYLKDADAGVRLEALEGARQDEALVLRMLDDAEPAVRRRAAAILAAHGSEAARSALGTHGFDPGTGSGSGGGASAGARARTQALHAVRTRAGDGAGAVPPRSDAVVVAVRAALRGRAPEEVASDLGWSEADAAAACARLEREGRLVRRGRRYYAA